MNHLYMKSDEFKNRQMWLDFGCAASIAYEILQKSVMDFRKWFKEWKPKKVVIKAVNLAKWLWVEMTSIQQNLFKEIYNGYDGKFNYACRF